MIVRLQRAAKAGRGMWSISVTDFFHNIILIAGLLFLAYLLWAKVPDFNQLVNSQPKHFFRAGFQFQSWFNGFF